MEDMGYGGSYLETERSSDEAENSNHSNHRVKQQGAPTSNVHNGNLGWIYKIKDPSRDEG